jgi:hypothetical protein
MIVCLQNDSFRYVRVCRNSKEPRQINNGFWEETKRWNRMFLCWNSFAIQTPRSLLIDLYRTRSSFHRFPWCTMKICFCESDFVLCWSIIISDPLIIQPFFPNSQCFESLLDRKTYVQYWLTVSSDRISTIHQSLTGFDTQKLTLNRAILSRWTFFDWMRLMVCDMVNLPFDKNRKTSHRRHWNIQSRENNHLGTSDMARFGFLICKRRTTHSNAPEEIKSAGWRCWMRWDLTQGRSKRGWWLTLIVQIDHSVQWGAAVLISPE